MIKHFLNKNLSLVTALVLLAGCSSNLVTRAPEYHAPHIQAAPAYRYASLNWVPVTQVNVAPTAWWQLYNDAVLNQLMQQLTRENLSLAQAEARYRRAQALLDLQQAQRLPNVSANGSAMRQGTKNDGPQQQFALGLQASWIPDLWGRVAKAIEAQQANLVASQADVAAVLLNQQLMAVQSYWNIRLLDLQLDVLAQTAQSYQRSLNILQNQYQAGMIARADVIQAETQLKTVQVEQIAGQRERALQGNILAVLLGQTVSQFDLAKQNYQFELPSIPVEVPSRLLVQRPDVIRAERALAVSHAALGLAQTAWLPDVSIGLNSAVNSRVFSQLFQSPAYLWSAGLNGIGTLFDGGARKAQIDQARANYDENLAIYKQSILTGWKEVEDALLQADSLKDQALEQQKLLDLAHENESVVLRRYSAGLVSYLEVVIAQNLRLQAEQRYLALKQSQTVNSMQLIAALGTGWQSASVVNE